MNLGKKEWLLPGGYIPLQSTGREPDFTSHDKISILNTSDSEALVEIEIFYEDKAPVGIYKLKVKPRRLRKIRFNDLIDPLPVPLETAYGAYIRSTVRVVVQFSKMITSGEYFSLAGSVAYCQE
jgi:hypothetical protein